MTEQEREELRIAIQRELFNRNFFEFVKWIASLLEPSTEWSWNFHHEYICNRLQSEVQRISDKRPRDNHININVPFRSSKSLIVSICLPLWTWTIDPNISFINLSYSDNLATDHSNKVFSLLHNDKFKNMYPFITLDDTQRSKTNFKLKGFSGSRISGGFGGTTLGKGADIIVNDDANNTRRLSDVERKNTIDTWRDTIASRLNNPKTGLFINVQQRLHDNDLSGYLLKNEEKYWEHICLPAELTSNVKPEVLAGEYKDGLLWPDRFSREVLDNYKERLGSIKYSNQLNQETAPPEGNIIKLAWIKIIPLEELYNSLNKWESNLTGKVKKDRLKWELFLDTAYTKDKKNDPTGVIVACKYKNHIYVRKAFELRLEFPDLIREIKRIHATYCDTNARIHIEPKASGLDIYNTLNREMNAIKIPHSSDDKETRLTAVSPSIESGKLILIEDTSNEIVIEQLTKFPNHEHDDLVDVVVYALDRYVGKSTEFNYALL